MTGGPEDVVRRYNEAVAARDSEAIFALLSEDVEFVTVDSPLDLDDVYRGHEGMRQFFRDWRGVWEPDGYELEMTEAGVNGDRVYVAARERARLKGSGAQVEQRWFQVLTVRDGLIVRWQIFLDPETARAAAGLEP